MNARSLSRAGSIPAKNGTWRSDSNSCNKLNFSSRSAPAPPGRCLSFGCDQAAHHRVLAVELGKSALLLQLAAADHQHALEIPREAGTVQHPDQAAPGHLPGNALGDPGLRLSVERRGRLIEDQQIRTLQQRTRDCAALPLRQRQTRAAGADLVIEADIDDG